MNRKKIILAVSAFVLLLVVIISGLHILESTVFNNEANLEPEQEIISTKTVEKDGVKYFPRQDITTVLFIGVDITEKIESSGFYVNDGSADVVAVVIFDEKNEKIDIIALNRDSIVEIPRIGLTGQKTGTFMGQLALSHTYGSGLEDSCLNTLETVSNLFGGVEIDHYVALNMGGIPALNDAVGGVTVNVTEDLSGAGLDIPEGEYTLKGEEAKIFVRARMSVGDGMNSSRMERQKEYAFGFMEAFELKTEQNDFFALEVYEDVSEYILTDCSLDTISALLEKFENYEDRKSVV